MAEIQRTSILNDANDELNTNLQDQLPKNVTGCAVVYPINHKYSTLSRYNATTLTGSTTLYTTPANKDFYITSACLAYHKDAACDSSIIHLTYIQDGATIRLLMLPQVTGEILQGQIANSYPFPIKCDRNTVIQYTGSFTAGTIFRAASITGFILE